MANNYFMGQGKIFLKKKGSAEGYLWVGDSDKFGIDTSQKFDDVFESYSGNRSVALHVPTETVTNIKMNLLQWNADNFKKALYADLSSNAAGSVTGETVKAYLGASAFLANPKVSSVVVKKGAATLVAGTDYDLFPMSGRLEFKGSTIVDGDYLTVNYSYAKNEKVQALMHSQSEYEVMFEGINIANPGEIVNVKVHRAVLNLPKSLGFLDNKHQSFELDGMLLADDTQAVGESKFFAITKA